MVTSLQIGSDAPTQISNIVFYICPIFGLGPRGYVQNLSDDMVKVVAEGNVTDLERFADALAMKNHIINVSAIEKQYTPSTGEFEGFGIALNEDDAELYEVAKGLYEMFSDSKSSLKERITRLESDMDKIKAKIGL